MTYMDRPGGSSFSLYDDYDANADVRDFIFSPQSGFGTNFDIFATPELGLRRVGDAAPPLVHTVGDMWEYKYLIRTAGAGSSTFNLRNMYDSRFLISLFTTYGEMHATRPQEWGFEIMGPAPEEPAAFFSGGTWSNNEEFECYTRWTLVGDGPAGRSIFNIHHEVNGVVIFSDDYNADSTGNNHWPEAVSSHSGSGTTRLGCEMYGPGVGRYTRA